MTRRYIKPPWGQTHIGNRLAPLFQPSLVSKLSVRGRRTGRWHTTPIAVLDYEVERYLVSDRGEIHWVRNLRVEEIAVEEVPVAERPPLLEVYTERYSRMPTVGAVLRELPDPADHPVFRITH